MEQQAQLPKFLNIGRFCEFTGMTRWNFKRVCDKYDLPLVDYGVSKMVEVDAAIRILARVPGVELMLSANGLELIQQLPALEQQTETAEQ